MKKREIEIHIENIKVEVLYHKFRNVNVNTLLVSFGEKRRVISTLDGYRKVGYIANSYQPSELSEGIMKNYSTFEEDFPRTLGIPRSDIAVLSTGANMNNLAIHEKMYQDRVVCCLATGGVGNALRTGVDETNWMEQEGTFTKTHGTINIIILTNVTLSDGALVRAIITATEAKTATLQDLDVRSSISPENQATGTGTDNMIVVSGTDPDKKVRFAGGHAKIGELIGVTTKIAVAETIKKHELAVTKI